MKQRYSPAHQALHWLTALGMLAVIVLAWLMRTAPENTEFSVGLYRWHETVGLIVFALTGYRLVLRWFNRPPPLPVVLARWDRWLAHATYVVFYALLIWMPVTGFLTTTAVGYAPKLFNVIETPALFEKSDALAATFATLHAGAQWPMYVLIVLHIAGVGFQLVVMRSGILDRMLPRQENDPLNEGELSASNPTISSRARA